MSFQAHGELVPVGGGDNIPLVREALTVGRRESCDICLRYPNVSGMHAQLTFRNGYWYIKDCNSTNGIKVNGVRVQEKMLHPRDEVVIGKRKYTIQYELPADQRAYEEVVEEDILSQSLLERAGLEKPLNRKDKRRGKGRDIDPADFLLNDD